MIQNDTIIALATPPGAGAIAIIRLSGTMAIALASRYYTSGGDKILADQKSHTVHLGNLIDAGKILDEALFTIFKGPHSYTGEDVVEISCHGSPYIQQQIIQLFLRNGCRMADAGEFTLRAFLNGKFDLSQAEAVADLIAAENEASHQIALDQMRGGFSNEIKRLRDELLQFASMIELELDFAEEDVEFANRDQFQEYLITIQKVLNGLIDSFAVGNVIKNGIPVAIVGEPNVGKSTLLNALLNEERAIVSEIAGTTRDTIEDEMTIGGVGFRFIDTAGIRETEDIVEGMGIQRTFMKIGKAQIVLYLVDSEVLIRHEQEIERLQGELAKIQKKFPNKLLITLLNKVDSLSIEQQKSIKKQFEDAHFIAAKSGFGIEELKTILLKFVNLGVLNNGRAIVSNTRHYDALLKALVAIGHIQTGMNEDLPGDLLAVDVKDALYHLGEITGEVTNEELLGNIFANFCIGK
jgi:tRNA modification GTPase